MELFLYAACCYLVGVSTFFFPRIYQVEAHYLSNTAALIGSALVTIATGGYYAGSLATDSLKWGTYSLAIDGWSSFFLLLTGIASMITSLYALGYGRSYEGNRLRNLGSNWNLFIVSMVFVLLAGDGFSFLLFWEIMAVASFMLVNHEAYIRTTWNAAYQYLVMTSLGTTFLMIAFLIVGAYSDSYSFVDMAHNSLTPQMAQWVFVTAFLGFALKAGLVPLHIWLPQAHPAAPSHVSALMSGVMLKIALYGFGRFMFSFIPTWSYWWAAVVMLAGAFSAFLGVLYAQMESDIKRVLAYSSVENMGVIFAAFGCGMLLKVTAGGHWYLIAMAAALLHAFNHSIMKVLMFMSAGSIMHGTGSKNLELFGGLARRMPVTAVCTFIGSLALAAIPLTCGFNGEWLALQGFITLARSSSAHDIRLLTAIAMILLGFTGALALGCFVRYFGIAFLGRERSEIAAHAHESDKFMLSAMSISSVLVMAAGIYPMPLMDLVAQAIGANTRMFTANQAMWWGTSAYSPILLLVVLAIVGGVVYLFASTAKYEVKEVTWNCGTDPTARQQYSAIGFSKPVRRAFDYILQPVRQRSYIRKDHAYFGRQLEYKLELPDMISRKLYQPVQKYFVVSSAFLRRLQQGSVRLYVGYVMAAMTVVLIWGAVIK
ncbi:MAG: NADH-quinone oxidoreductase subunit E [Phascolarctobacterium sp.]|nr:NADH-quinone oxidoreductase subunit E [Phascolarctobacterium sp.]